MSKISKELIESYRKIVLPFVSNRLYKTNFEGQGETDKAAFEQDFNEILDLAISALSPTGDCISREVLKDITYINKGNFNTVEGIREWIDKAPAVDISGSEYFPYRTAYFNGVEDGRATARPKGEWIDDSPTSWKCSCCGYGVNRWNNTPFCPNCGIKMQFTEKE